MGDNGRANFICCSHSRPTGRNRASRALALFSLLLIILAPLLVFSSGTALSALAVLPPQVRAAGASLSSPAAARPPAGAAGSAGAERSKIDPSLLRDLLHSGSARAIVQVRGVADLTEFCFTQNKQAPPDDEDRKACSCGPETP